jgi:hypothetical protein
MPEYTTKDPLPRRRSDVDEAIAKMNESMTHRTKPRIVQRLLNFQVFVSFLLMVLVIITSSSFYFAMRSEREARALSDERSVGFEQHVSAILDSVRASQEQAHNERVLIIETLEDVHAELLDDIREMVADHVAE